MTGGWRSKHCGAPFLLTPFQVSDDQTSVETVGGALYLASWS